MLSFNFRGHAKPRGHVVREASAGVWSSSGPFAPTVFRVWSQRPGTDRMSRSQTVCSTATAEGVAHGAHCTSWRVGWKRLFKQTFTGSVSNPGFGINKVDVGEVGDCDLFIFIVGRGGRRSVGGLLGLPLTAEGAIKWGESSRRKSMCFTRWITIPPSLTWLYSFNLSLCYFWSAKWIYLKIHFNDK